LEETSTGTILRCAAACASRGRPRRRRLCLRCPRRARPTRRHIPHSPAARRAPCSPIPLWPLRMARVCVQEYGSTALMAASQFGHEGCVRLLIESGATVNATDVSLERPLLSTLPWVRFHIVISFVSSLLSSEHRRRLSFASRGMASRGMERPPRDRQAPPRRRRRCDASRQSRQDGHRLRTGEGPQRGRGPAERASVGQDRKAAFFSAAALSAATL